MLTNNSKRFGWLEYGKAGWKNTSIMFCTGDDEYPRNNITVYIFGWVIRVDFPQWIQPHKEKVVATFWDESTIQRLGRNYYYNYFRKEYGLSVSNGTLHVRYGPQTHDSWSCKSKCYFLPWRSSRFHSLGLYDENGKLFFEETASKRADIQTSINQKELCPKVCFLLRDYDGELIIATTLIVQRHWKRGDGWCSWLSFFCKDIISRSLDISFSGETGKEKRSWKGGTMGTGIEMLPGETHQQAMVRYCQQEHRSKSGKYKIEFIERVESI